jgi:hypothetical protein
MSDTQEQVVNELIKDGFRIYDHDGSVHLMRKDEEFNVYTLKSVDWDGNVKNSLRRGA